MTSRNSHTNEERLEQITVNIVNELTEVGVYHYNKLTFLFEYLFIKNFGMKYTGESFLKLPHGPVIKGYKKIITDQTKKGLLSCDLEDLNLNRKLDEDYNLKIFITKTENGNSVKIEQSIVKEFLLKVLDKYAHLTTDQLEEKIYDTTPVKKYIEQFQKGFKKEIGGYVMDCITIKQFNTQHTQGRRKALQHFLKSKPVSSEQLIKYQKEFQYLEYMRP